MRARFLSALDPAPVLRATWHGPDRGDAGALSGRCDVFAVQRELYVADGELGLDGDRAERPSGLRLPERHGGVLARRLAAIVRIARCEQAAVRRELERAHRAVQADQRCEELARLHLVDIDADRIAAAFAVQIVGIGAVPNDMDGRQPPKVRYRMICLPGGRKQGGRSETVRLPDVSL